MKILHYSDQKDINLREYFIQADVMFVTGDLSIFHFHGIMDIISSKPSFGVYGNHCCPGYLEELGIKNVNLRVDDWNGLRIGGFEGCLRYKPSGGPQFTEEAARDGLANFEAVDILLLHAAPFQLLDTPGDIVHTGSKEVRNYVDKVHPKYIFCGHDSPSMEKDFNGTKIFRTHGARIIEI